MDEAEQFALGLGDERMDRLVGVEETHPGRGGDVGGKRGGAAAAVEFIIALPPRQPAVEIALHQRADPEIGGHRYSTLGKTSWRAGGWQYGEESVGGRTL